MRLDKDHLDQFENISPPLIDCLSLPVIGKEGVCVRVSRSAFNDTAKRLDVLEVAGALMLDSGVDLTDDLARRLAQHDGCSRFGKVDFALLEAVRLSRNIPRRSPELQSAIDEAREALIGDSNDAEHDALVSLMEALGQTLPEGKD
jgi:hypothetical protein